MISQENNATVIASYDSSQPAGAFQDLAVESRGNGGISVRTEKLVKVLDAISRVTDDWVEVRQVDLLAGKLVDFLYESTVALAKTVMFCTSLLMFGLLPGKGVGNLWPPFKWQVFGPEISTYFLDPYSFLHFEVSILNFSPKHLTTYIVISIYLI